MVHSRTLLSSGATEMGQVDSSQWNVSADCKHGPQSYSSLLRCCRNWTCWFQSLGFLKCPLIVKHGSQSQSLLLRFYEMGQVDVLMQHHVKSLSDGAPVTGKSCTPCVCISSNVGRSNSLLLSSSWDEIGCCFDEESYCGKVWRDASH